MSTEIKNTLFRFITMRAPEVLSKKSKDLGFVFHPDLINDKITSTSTSFFKVELVTPKDTASAQLKALIDKAITFTNGLLMTKVDLENLVTTSFYDYSEAYSKIKSDTEKSREIVESKAGIIPQQSLENDKLIQLWDNLFYQLITQKNPSLRDAIMNVLICNHTLNFVKQDIKFLKTSIVIPPSFYGVTTAMEKNLSIADTKKVTIDANIKENLKNVVKNESFLSLQKNVLKVKAQVQTLEKKYRKSESLLLENEQIRYSREVEAAYSVATFIDEKIENNITGEIKIVRNYSDLNLPKFEYVPKPEINNANIVESIGNEITSLISLDKLKEITSYKEVYQLLDELLELSNIEVNNLFKINQTTAVVAGQIINTPQSLFTRSSNTIPYTASLTYTNALFEDYKTSNDINRYNNGTNPSTINNWINFLIAISNIDLSDLVENFNVFNISKLDGTDLFGPLTLNANMDSSNTLVFSEINNDYPFQIPKDIRQVKVTASILLTDTSILNIDTTINVGAPLLTNMIIRTGDGVVTLQSNTSNTGTNGNNDNPAPQTPSTNPSTTPPTTVTEANSVFVPSRFGVKNLGVADYRKVEQEICCYEPGEVSHIENIMAREYKEKATERLRSTDTTLTKSSERESENLTDTTTTTRNEMHSEVAQIIAEDTQVNLNTQYNWGKQGVFGGSINAGFANNTSQEDSSMQAQTYAQDVTQRAMERVVTKTKSELITKIIESYKENNKHGFDNTKGEENVSGVYRFINKVYNNQIVNYGKRAMVEFMIPEPSRFHILASIKNPSEDSIVLIKKPVDPRSLDAGIHQIATYKEVAKPLNADNYIYWCSLYGVEAEIPPASFLSIGKSFTKSEQGGDGGNKTNKASSADVDVPFGYQLLKAKATWEQIGQLVYVKVADLSLPNNVEITFAKKYTNKIPVSVAFEMIWLANVNVNIEFERTEEFYLSWKNRIFNSIIEAYESKLEAYNNAVADAKRIASETIEANPMYYRQIERNILKKNIVHYLVDAKYMGQDYLDNDDDLTTLKPNNSAVFNENTSVARFMEQAFEWDIISYNFYPFYWGSTNRWKQAYNFQFKDALFTNFMQAGMARVVVTVRPGFEKAVNWYMATGQVWNGGQVPTLGEELFLSIDQELKDVEPKAEGLPWKTKVPSDLTIIQSSTIGLDAQGLPCGCPETVGGEVNLGSKIIPSNAIIGGPKTQLIEPVTPA